MSFFDKLKKIILNKKKLITFATFNSSTTKQIMNGSCSLRLSTKTEEIKKEIHEELKTKIKKYMNTPEKLVQYIKLKGVNVYRIKNAERLLAKFGEEEGFITPLKGFKAVLFSCLVLQKFSLTTKEMMVFDNGKIEIYTVARALYKYYGFSKNLPGYDYKSQEVFKRIYSNRKKTSAEFDKCSIRDIFACKEALARDMESIKFTVELSNEYENAKKTLKKLKESSANI